MSDGFRVKPGDELDFNDALESPEEPGIDEREEAWFPSSVTVAGLMWIILGCLVMLNALLAQVLAILSVWINNRGQVVAYTPGSVCGILFVLLFGLAFLLAGLRTMRGTAYDTFGAAVGSIAFSLLEWGLTVFLVVSGQFIEAGILSLIAASFLAAGILALIGRRQYKLWLNSHRSRRFKRLDADEQPNF